MPFHRYVDASYAILPGDSYSGGSGNIGGVAYDRINVTSGGTGGGDGSANADAAKTGLPNAGTYFQAFGEHGISLYVNRANKALGENCDAIDDILHESVPLALSSVSDVAVGDVSSHVATGIDVFVGAPGAPTGPADYYARVVDANGDNIYRGSAAVAITAITNGATNVMGATSPDGFYTGPTFVFTPAIPTGVSYKIIFGARSALGRSTEEIHKHEINVAHLLDIYNLGNLGHVRYKGLDEAYRRSSVVPGGTSGTALPATLDEAGDGAVITRDGKAVTVQFVPQDWSTIVQPDKFLASYIACPTDGSGLHVNAKSGEMGYVFLTSLRHSATEVNEKTSENRPLSGFVGLNQRRVTGTVGSQPAYTLINDTTTAVLNAAGVGTDQITLNAGCWFKNSGKTAVALKRDILVLTVAGKQQAYIIKALDAVLATQATLCTLGGAAPVFLPNTAVTKVEWLQPTFCAGGSGDASSTQWSAFGYMEPPALSDAAVTAPRKPPSFISGPSGIALEWGGFDKTTGNRLLAGSIFGSPGAGVQLNTGRVFGHMESPGNWSGALPVGPSVAYVWDPLQAGSGTLQGPLAAFSFIGTGNVVLTLSFDATYASTAAWKEGDRLTVIVYNNKASGTITIDWPGTGLFKFSGSDEDLTTLVIGDYVKYEFLYVNFLSAGGGAHFLATRTDY